MVVVATHASPYLRDTLPLREPLLTNSIASFCDHFIMRG